MQSLKKRLLITTQAIDLDDPILGFFHGWVKEFSNAFESIDVICLRKGRYSLPPNVRIHSLGKEGGESKLKYIFNFYRILFTLGWSYEKVFVHMNPHYILLGGIVWRLLNRQIFFWRNHARLNTMTRIAALFAKKIFYTSPFACTSVYKHAYQMPVGIDTHVFTPAHKTIGSTKKILFLGRLSPVKRVEIFIEAAALLPKEYEMHIYGDDPSKEKKYEKELKSIAGKNVYFHPSVKNIETPNIYRSHELYVNLTPEGSMDKTVLEAAACGVLVLASNRSFEGFLPSDCFLETVTPHSVARKIETLPLFPESTKATYREALRKAVVEHHSLEALASQLAVHMETGMEGHAIGLRSVS